jgi:hypothetical protein
MTIDTIMNPARPTAAQVKAAFQITLAVSEAIREAGSIPSGELYAILCGRVDLQGYDGMIRTLKNAGLISESANMLTWIGPKFEGGR